jgi:hypothetical protein
MHQGLYPRGGGPILRPYQRRTLLDLARGTDWERGVTYTIVYPRQAGKNELAATFVAYLLASHATRGGCVVVCAPTATPQVEISLARVRRTLEQLASTFPGSGQPRFAGTAAAFGRAWAVFLSASDEAHVAGHTASLALVADEAQEIDEAWFDRQFRPMTASTGAPVFLFGTPWNGETLLDRAVAANLEFEAAHGQPEFGWPRPRHYMATWREVGGVVRAYEAHVLRERARLGAGNPLFLTQYELETVHDAGRLLTAEELRAIEGSHERLRAPAEGERYVAGLDLAGQGSDASVLTLARVAGGVVEVVEALAWERAPFPQLEAEVHAAIDSWRPARVVADAGGLGAPIVARLADVLAPGVVEPFTFTGASKSQLGFDLIAAVRGGRLSLWALDFTREARSLRAQLGACLADYRGPGRVDWHAPSGAHDDYVVSLALCVRALVGPPRLAQGRHTERG